jgi:hypothetical protein
MSIAARATALGLEGFFLRARNSPRATSGVVALRRTLYMGTFKYLRAATPEAT